MNLNNFDGDPGVYKADYLVREAGQQKRIIVTATREDNGIAKDACNGNEDCIIAKLEGELEGSPIGTFSLLNGPCPECEAYVNCRGKVVSGA